MSEDIDLRQYRCPSFCPQCDVTMRGHLSTKSYYDYGVCNNCYIEFIEDRQSRWKEGWRPTQEQIESYKKRLFGTN
jgi:hypothetical protein